MKYPAIIINGNSYFNMKYLINVSIYHSNYDLIRKMKNSYYITQGYSPPSSLQQYLWLNLHEIGTVAYKNILAHVDDHM